MAKALPLEQIEVFGKQNPPDPDFDFGKAAILLVNKPQQWTSFDVVKYVRNRLGIKKVGHAGTLDPIAEGLLILCSGRATKSISQIQEMKKTYVAEITFGASTPSYDADSEIDETAPFEHITLEKIVEALETDFTGDIMQVPPMYSALKRDGKRLYELARRGKTLELEPRPVSIYDHQVISFDGQKLIISITCSKGTYIRSVAHDLGLALESRAHLTQLMRTAIGEYSVANALSPEEINQALPLHG